MNGRALFDKLDGTQACSEANPDEFFADGDYANPGPMEVERVAATYCRRCPFIRDCLAYALTHDVAGIWAGTSYRQRVEIRTANGITADRTGLFVPVVGDEVQQMTRGGGFRE